jgi:glycosyltransferase involved in cell wall biosynthesis
MAKALVIAPQPFFSPRGTPLSVYYRTLVTAKLGVEVDLLTYGQGEDVDIPGVRIIRIPPFRLLGSVKVGPSGLKLFLDVFMLLWVLGLLLRRRYDFVHAHEESVFFCRYLQPIFRFKLVYDMHSSLPQQLTNFGFTTSRSLIRVFAMLENSCLRHADAVITICPGLAEHARSPAARTSHRGVCWDLRELPGIGHTDTRLFARTRAQTRRLIVDDRRHPSPGRAVPEASGGLRVGWPLSVHGSS